MTVNRKSAASRRCAVIYSGGKDSHLAALAAAARGFKVESLIYFDGGRSHARFFNDIRKPELIKLHARLMGAQLCVIRIRDFSRAREERTSGLIAEVCRARKINKVYCGASENDPLALRLRKNLARKGIRLEAPLIKLGFAAVVRECLRRRVRAIVTGVSKRPRGLRQWLKKPLSPALAGCARSSARAAERVNGDNFQTAVLESPLFAGAVRPSGFSESASREQYFLRIKNYAPARPRRASGPL